jgi:hypothetical protein
MMRYVMKNEGLASGEDDPTVGCWLKSYDPEAHDGRGEAIWTADKDQAMKFESQAIAMQLWLVVPRARPVRADGRPNKPLTAFSVTIEPA